MENRYCHFRWRVQCLSHHWNFHRFRRMPRKSQEQKRQSAQQQWLTQNQLKWYIDPKGDGHFYELGKEGSGLTWDQNYGWDGAQPTGGFWFNPIKTQLF